MESTSYFLTRLFFQRSLAAIYLIAFLIAFNQFVPLCGERGLAPITFLLKRFRFTDSPSLFFFYYSDQFAKILAFFGIVLSIFALSGCSEAYGNAVSAISWFLLWATYLSFVNAGQLFYGFGWETLLLETGFLAIFLGSANSAVPVIVIYLLRWTLFRLMFGAGMIKIRGDQCWSDLTCLFYHFETQPVPNPISSYLHRLPQVSLKFGVLFNHFVELVVPFAFFLPGKFVVIAGALTAFFQITLIISGNLSFLNYLTIVVCIACFDDNTFRFFYNFHKPVLEQLSPFHTGSVRVLLLTVLYLSIQPLINLFSSSQRMNTSYEPLHLVNSYGAFGSITKKRMEIILEGTNDSSISDSTEWKEYQFKVKPGDTSRPLPLMSPYHYRLDWHMWFAAMSSVHYHPWLVNLVEKLLANDPTTLKLIKFNPFTDSPPKFIRALHYEYKFSSEEVRKQTGKYWSRTLKSEYFPPFSLNN